MLCAEFEGIESFNSKDGQKIEPCKCVMLAKLIQQNLLLLKRRLCTHLSVLEMICHDFILFSDHWLSESMQMVDARFFVG